MSDNLENAADFAAVPDAFQRLWTPHRLVYIQQGQQPADDECPFCLAPSLSDEDGLIVRRGEYAYVLLNLFPYNSGHLLVCPYRHVDTYDKASVDEVAEIALLTQQAMQALQNSSGNHGFNIGMNFFPIIAQTKALPMLLGEVRSEIAAAWPSN